MLAASTNTASNTDTPTNTTTDTDTDTDIDTNTNTNRLKAGVAWAGFWSQDTPPHRLHQVPGPQGVQDQLVQPQALLVQLQDQLEQLQALGYDNIIITSLLREPRTRVKHMWLRPSGPRCRHRITLQKKKKSHNPMNRLDQNLNLGKLGEGLQKGKHKKRGSKN